MPRFHCPLPGLATGLELDLPAGAARHVQVLRMQPGDCITLFHGGLPQAPAASGAAVSGGEFEATVLRMGRSDVRVMVGAHAAVEREAMRAVHLVVGMPANDRMDWLVEKATELGVASIQPVATARTVLRLSGERAEKKRAHWQAVAVAACEQCGRNRVPAVQAPMDLSDWLRAIATVDDGSATGERDVPSPGGTAPASAPIRLLLSLQQGALPVVQAAAGSAPVWALHGPEGGLTGAEESTARAAGFVDATLGSRVLRAETAALALLAVLAG